MLEVVSPPLDDVAADAALVGLAGQLSELSTPCLLLVDAKARTASITFSWLERGLLLPLVRAERLMAVIISRSPLRWREFDTRRRAEVMTLTPLDRVATAEQLGLTARDIDVVYALTGGLPLANELARHVLKQHPVPREWDADIRDELMRGIVETLYARVDPGLTDELHCTLEVLSVVREFALPLMQQLLLAYCGEQVQPRSQTLQLIAIKQLQELDLVLWDQASLSYRVAPVLRRLIAEQLRRSNPERYQTIQQTACTYYRQMLDEVLVSRHVHLVELLWHLLDGRYPPDQPPVELLRGLVARYLTSPDGRQIDDEAISILRVQLVTDPDLPAVLQRYATSVDELVTILDAALSGGIATT